MFHANQFNCTTQKFQGRDLKVMLIPVWSVMLGELQQCSLLNLCPTQGHCQLSNIGGHGQICKKSLGCLDGKSIVVKILFSSNWIRLGLGTLQGLQDHSRALNLGLGWDSMPLLCHPPGLLIGEWTTKSYNSLWRLLLPHISSQLTLRAVKHNRQRKL